MDLLSPHLPPPSTVRRNPPRKAKQSSSVNALIFSNSSKPAATAADGSVGISAFPLEELLQPEPPQVHPPPDPKPFKSNEDASNNLKIFLRIRPLEGRAETGAPRSGKGSKEAVGMNSRCLCVNSSTSVTLNAPPLALDCKRAKSEVYDGFSCVFPPESIQEDIYDKVMQPMVMGFLEGHSSLLVAMGPTGSGKTYTMFGSAQQLGIVPLALRQIFKHKNELENIQATRTYYLSMFEIYSERGKGEKIFDLSPELIDLPHQQSSINMVKEVHISNVTDAEKIVAYGMHKRSTASTNANNLSSRSQCVINISSVLKSDNGEHLLSNPILTIADLAGAERERKTGNQGARLMESNFINNTSMVFGLCLRSLLEHQKNPKKPIEKHYKNSLLTRYLQDYMEGKKRMTLILTVKAGKVDYMDTTFVLRQASPYMKIKFNHLQENTKLQCQKRTITSTRIKKSKRRKVGVSEASLIDGDDVVMDAATRSQISEKGSIAEGSNVKQDNKEFLVELQKAKRSEEVMKNFARALLSMLKQYKFKLKESENEVQFLKESLTEQSAHAAELGKELKELRCSCSCLNNPPVEECAGHLPFDHCDGVPLLPVDQDVALPEENHASLESENEVQFLKESLREHSAHAAELGKELKELRCSCSCLNNPPVEECPGHLPVDHCNGVPLLPVDQDVALPDENHASLVEFSSGPYSGLSLEGNAKDQSYQYLDENPERSQKSTQTELKLGGEDGVVVDMPDTASILGPHDNVPVSKSEFSEETSNPDYCILRSCDPFEREGCNLHLDGSEGTTIMQAKKEQQKKFAMLDDVQQDNSSNGTALKSSAHDPALRPLNSTKPKRKLLPASAMLLKDLNGLDMDDNAKDIKGKANSYAKERSDGSISLIRILRNNLPR